VKYFIFKNFTIEYLFKNTDAEFSGYEDVSYFNKNSDAFMFLYFLPLDFYKNSQHVLSQIRSKVNYLLEVLPKNKPFYLFTIENLFKYQLVESKREHEQDLFDYNFFLYEQGKKHPQVKILNIDSFYKMHDFSDLINWKFFYTYNTPLSPDLSKSFSEWFLNRINKIEHKRKKCLILDLDNTLWGGIVGENGVGGICLGGDYPGNVFSDFQKMILELKAHGVILGLCSKNNLSDAEEVFLNHPSMILKWGDFVIKKINWSNKDQNLAEIAAELNIGTDSIVFVDDNPSEREQVKRYIEDIIVPDFPNEPYKIIPHFAKIFQKYFALYVLTEEDSKKTKQYEQKMLSQNLSKKFLNHDDFIKDLSINLQVSPVNAYNLSRFAQLCQKTNQFNLTTIRHTEMDLTTFMNAGHFLSCLSVSDKFGDHGITGAAIVILDRKKNEATIDTFLLSCRVLGKGIQNAYLVYILNKLFLMGIKRVFTAYVKSSKNSQTERFYDELGFKVLKKTDLNTQYEIVLNEPLKQTDLFVFTGDT